MSARPQQGATASVLNIYLVAAVVCAAISAAAYVWGVRPALVRHDAQRDRQAELQLAKQKTANLNGTRNHVLTQLAAVNETLNNLPLHLEPASTVNQRISVLTLVTRECGLNIDEMRAGLPVDAADYQTVPILIAGSGTYSSVAKFLHTIRKRFPDTAVRSFETINNSASPEMPAATFQFDLVWHAAKS